MYFEAFRFSSKGGNMHSFKSEILDTLVSHDISLALGVIHEARGKQELYERQKPEVLKTFSR